MQWLRLKVRKFRKWRARRQLESSLLKSGKSFSAQKKIAQSLLIGPANSAGQASAWASALRATGKSAQSLRIANSEEREWFDADITVERLKWTQASGRVELVKQVSKEFTHLLLESARPLFALRTERTYNAKRALEDLLFLDKMGKQVGIVLPGSGIRDSTWHGQLNPYSPYREMRPEMLAIQERAADARIILPALKRKKIPVFVTTHDLFHEIPWATWLPIAVDLQPFLEVAKGSPAFTNAGPIRVIFLPSKGWIKSAAIIEPILDQLEREGIIVRVRSESVAHSEVPQLLATCDVVVDQFTGIYGALAIEALAAGRTVISHLESSYYENSGVNPPIVEATPESLRSVLMEIADTRKATVNGSEFAQRWHSGAMSAQVIKDKLL
ncbi:MAG: hypothetical protein WCL15_05305 [Actinomycetes bacterium]